MYRLSRNHANGQSVVEKELCNSTAKAVCEAYLTSIFRHIFLRRGKILLSSYAGKDCHNKLNRPYWQI